MENKYQPSKEALKFIAFIRATGVEDNASPEIHYKLADKYFGKDKQVLIEAFRGSAKSTLMEWFVIYAAAMGEVPNFGPVEFIAFVGDSMENGTKNFFRNVAGKIDKSTLLQQLLTIRRKTDSEMELVNADGKELNIKGYGAATNIRGVRYKGVRPDIIILDDITTNDAISSEAIQKTIDDNFYKSIIPALHPTRYKIFYIGTPLNERDLIHQLSNNPEWTVHKFPICEKFPCEKEDFVGNWIDRFPYEAVKSKYDMYKASGKAQDFAQEYMLELLDLSDLLVEEGDINWFDPTQVIKNRSAYNYYISTDFATSTKKSADFSTIGVWGISNNGDWLLVDGQCKRQTMQENIEDLFKYVQKWKPISVGIESSGQQGGFISILQDMMLQRNVWFQFAKKPGSKEPGIRPNKDKVHRFVTGVQPKFKQGKVWFPREEQVKMMNPNLYGLLEELQNELSKFTMAGGVKSLKHDDCGTYDTKVDTPTGSKLLGEIKNGDEVISYGPRGSAISKVKDARITGIKPITNIELEDGTLLRFSEFHPMLTGTGYKLARDIQVGDKLVRNIKWKEQLSLTDLNGQKSQEGTTNQLQDVQTEAERTGYISMCMKKLTERFRVATKYITKMKTKITTIYPIWNYLAQNSTKLSTKSKIRLVEISLLTMWNRTLMRFKNWLKKEKLVHTLENARDKSCQTSQSNVLTAEQSLHHMQKLEKTLSAAVTYVETNGMTNMPNRQSVENVEQYLNQVLEVLDTAPTCAETSRLKKELKSCMNMYVSCAEKRSKDMYIRLAAEMNAKEIGKTNLNENTVEVKKVWISKPEATYNFEVDTYHNYQVYDGYVVHNCLDLLNQLSEMELFEPSEDAGGVTPEVQWTESQGWSDIWDNDKISDGSGNSTVF